MNGDMRRVPSSVALVSALLALPPSGAQAAPQEDAEALIREGIELRRAGKPEPALAKFRRAYEVAPSPRSAAQLGLCEQDLSFWADAEAHLGEALRAADHPWIRANRAVLEQSLGTVRRHVSRIEIVGGPEGATIEVAGKRVGTLPLAGPVRVAEGYVEIRASAPGYRTMQRSLTIGGGQSGRVTVELERAPVAESPPPVVPVTPTVTAEAPRPPAPSSGRRVVALGLLGAGAAAGVGGVLLTLRAAGKRDRIEDAAREGERFDERDGNWRTLQRWSVAAYATSLAAVGAGATLLWLGRAAPDEAPPTVAGWWGPEAGGLLVKGAF
jgi:tetratricopeptide (TPR) repeat protein